MTVQTFKALYNRNKNSPNFIFFKILTIFTLLIDFSQQIPFIGKLHYSTILVKNIPQRFAILIKKSLFICYDMLVANRG